MLDAGQGRHVLAVPDFRRVWLVGLAVSVARWLEMLVIGILVFQQTGSPFLVAAMTLLRLVPMGLFGALLGVVADRVQRSRALIAVLMLQAFSIGMLAMLAFAGELAVWQIALACFANGFGWAADNPVRRMMIGDIVGPGRMGSAMSIDVMANNASRIAGPALGGTTLAALGAGPALLLSALLYLAALLPALRIRYRSTVAVRSAPVLREMQESFALVLRVPAMRGVMAVTLIFNLFAWPFTSMVPVIGHGSLQLGPEGVGLLASMDGIGALLGAALIGLLARPTRYARFYVAGTAAYLAMVTAFALAPGPISAGLALLLVGIGGAGFSTMQATLTYLAAPPEIRSRALGVLSVVIGMGLLGFLHLGLMANLLGAPAATALIGAEGLLALLLTRPLWRRLAEATAPEKASPRA